LKEKRKSKTNYSIAQGGGKPTFIVPKRLKGKQATKTIDKMLTNPHPSLEDDLEMGKYLKQANPKLTRGR
jgi:hypothetical protein